jgi:hypothetical protein
VSRSSTDEGCQRVSTRGEHPRVASKLCGDLL